MVKPLLSMCLFFFSSTYSFLDTQLATNHSNINVQIIAMLGLGTSYLT